MIDFATIRQAIQELPNLAMASTGNPPTPADVFFPASHALALEPDVSLVIGNRGMGKTFWTLALASEEVRPLLSERYVYLRRSNMATLDVKLGFADAEGAAGAISRAVLESLPDDVQTEIIWRAVLVRVLAPYIAVSVPDRFFELVQWVRENPEAQLEIFTRCDAQFTSSGTSLLVVFDQLDQLATDWSRIQALTQGLIKIALAMKSYRSLKIKIFMRTDQAENKELFRFPDGSKILGGSKVLRWRASDLFGLLFFEILKSPVANGDFRKLCESLGVNFNIIDQKSKLPHSLVTESVKQSEVFHSLAGPFMGRNEKRGRPYTWLPAHLADGRGEISPRVFLHVMRVAAQADHLAPGATAVDYRGILEGVRDASSVRLAELEEDYPWVSDALSPLRGLLVPCEPAEIIERWRGDKTIDHIAGNYKGSRAPLDIPIASLFGDEESDQLISLLSEIGVFEERANGKINIPDIFRVNAGILRKGGIPPQERNRF
ncbi:hypothetical protein [Rhizobium leguminosarum]|uniref:hypothetical protein n=1 Tax=Rhizobium TaxID=379 RepID=UPI001C949735|nr:hypothetical protein [Rhizobium leguminosarum]MBY5391026.1 hypothetical protein [Rhizobium leguminosarum]